MAFKPSVNELDGLKVSSTKKESRIYAGFFYYTPKTLYTRKNMIDTISVLQEIFQFD